MRDYPQMIAATDRVEPAPRHVRAVLAGKTIVDTTRARHVWEWPNYPQYYIPLADVDVAALVDEERPQRLRRATAHRHGLRVGETVHVVAVLDFESEEAFTAYLSSPTGLAAVADFPNFAGAGATLLNGPSVEMTEAAGPALGA